MELWVIIFGATALILYILLDVHYFVRVALTYVIAKYFRSRVQNFLEPSAVYGICLPSDADFMITHMNNSRYLREYDFARFDFATRVGLMDEVLKKGGNFPVAALTIRYRLPLMVFSPYKVLTTPVWWDKKSLYLDQRVVTLKDGIVRAVGYTKIAMVKIDLEAILAKRFPNLKKPQVPEDLQKWIEGNDLSSDRMKQK